MPKNPKIDWEIHLWTEETLKELQENGEDQAWQKLLKGEIDVLEWSERIGEIRAWVNNEIKKLNN